jgi:alkanesulfonate monooxygenase SsuD/methylene tetrahydromethanopterin reductase-like flavin-dependent oxidoreductase (luciferase family)
MKFSLIYEAQMVDTSRANEAKVFHETIEQCLLAEELGFDTVWAVEHTSLTQYSHMSAPETFLAFLAGRTTRLGIGHGVVCLPHKMNHPIKVAERIATLDILSKGRLHFGMGKGGTQQEAGAFGEQLDKLQPQIDESMNIIPKMWRDGVFEYKSATTGLEIPPRPIHPKPYQDPHPPLYMACTRHETLVTAGKRGLGALVLGFGGPEDIRKKVQTYHESFDSRDQKDQVGEFATRHVAALCPATVLDDAERARRVGVRGQRFFAESLARWYQNGPEPQVDDLDAEETINIMDKSRQQVEAYLGQEKIPYGTEATGLYNAEHAYGSAAQCINYVQQLIDAGADEILFLVQMGTVPGDVQLETVRNIGKHVIPYFREQAKKSAAASKTKATEVA